MSVKIPRARRHEDRASISVSDHAVERFRERGDAAMLSSDEVRRVLVDAYERSRDHLEPHHVDGQLIFRFAWIGTDLVGVVAKDKTGWSTSGRCVATVLTPDQLVPPKDRA